MKKGWAGLWLIFYRHPDEHPALTQEEADYIATGQEQDQKFAGSERAGPAREGGRPPIRQILSQRNFWGIALPRFFADPVWGTLVYWMPLYLYQARGFDLKTIALTAWLPFVAADFGCMMGGTISAYLNKRFGILIVDGKRVAFSLGAVLMIGMAGVGFVKDPAVAIFLLCLGGFAHQTLSISVISLSADLFPKNEVATVTGMASFVAGLGNLGFTLMIGWLVSSIGYTPFFVALGCGDLIGMALLWTLVRPRAQTLGRDVPSAANA